MGSGLYLLSRYPHDEITATVHITVYHCTHLDELDVFADVVDIQTIRTPVDIVRSKMSALEVVENFMTMDYHISYT